MFPIEQELYVPRDGLVGVDREAATEVAEIVKRLRKAIDAMERCRRLGSEVVDDDSKDRVRDGNDISPMFSRRDDRTVIVNALACHATFAANAFFKNVDSLPSVLRKVLTWGGAGSTAAELIEQVDRSLAAGAEHFAGMAHSFFYDPFGEGKDTAVFASTEFVQETTIASMRSILAHVEAALGPLAEEIASQRQDRAARMTRT